MESIQIPVTIYGILGTLCALGATTAFAANTVSLMVAKQWHYKSGVSILNRGIGFIFNIWNKQRAVQIFEGGTYEEIERRTDTQAPARGVIWAIFATIFLVLSIVNIPSYHVGYTKDVTHYFVLFPDIFILVALAASMAYGSFAERIFGNKEQRAKADKDFGILGHVHQFWLNFIGSGAGWVSLYLFISFVRTNGIENLSFLHLTLFLVAVLGIIGWLPMTLAGVSNALASAVERLINKI
jgi:hypothetical protein